MKKLFVLSAAGIAIAMGSASSQEELQPVTREFRGVWVATVANIDWPSKPGLNSFEQQTELLAILNKSVQLNLNAVILQVRPATDALYSSQLEPWSEFLTAQMGRPPEPAYDPLAFAVAEAHKRGLELHAWFNPYRSLHPSAKSSPSTNHLSESNPALVRRYGRHLWLDPGDPRVRRHSIKVITDVVKRYDIDGVHIDDYFYPYKERDSAGVIIDFPDSATYARYTASGGTLSRHDWRRNNVDVLVKELYTEIKRTKRWVKFGISPFGIWRPGYPESIKGFDAYAELYADSKKWLNEGWMDYFTPQLYWPINRPDVSYPVLLRWWVSENAKNRNMWPGNFTSRVGATGETSWKSQELLDQISTTRLTEGATGNVHFSMKVFMQNRDSLVDRLLAGPYAGPALVPRSPWLDSIAPRKPVAYLVRDSITRSVRVQLAPSGVEKAWLWVVRYRVGPDWSVRIFPGSQSTHMFGPGVVPDQVAVSQVDRLGNESRSVTAELRKTSPASPGSQKVTDVHRTSQKNQKKKNEKK